MAKYTASIQFGDEDDALMCDVSVEADSLTDAIVVAEKIDVWKQVLRSGVSFNSGKFKVTGVFRG